MNHNTQHKHTAKAAAVDPLAAVTTETIRPDPQPLTGAASESLDTGETAEDLSEVVETVIEKPVKNPDAALSARTVAKAHVPASRPAQQRQRPQPQKQEAPDAPPPPVAPAVRKWRLMNDVTFSNGISFVRLKAGRILEAGRGEDFFKRLKAAGGLLEEVA